MDSDLDVFDRDYDPYDYYDTDDGGYYGSDDGGYYGNDDGGYFSTHYPYYGVDVGVEVDVEPVLDTATDYGGELDGQEADIETEEDDGVEVEVEAEAESDDDYVGELEVPIEDHGDDFDQGRARIGYEDQVWRIPSSLAFMAPAPGGAERRREIDRATAARTQTVLLGNLVETQFGNYGDNGGQEPRRETNSQAETLRNVRENDGSGGVSVTEAKAVSDSQKKEDSEEASSSVGKGAKLNGRNMDGFSCAICMEPWTTDGEHYVCCLPCGHLYGMSCIKSWLLRPNSGKCPQCNKACTPVDIRRIYGLTIGTMEKELQEKIMLLEAKCASLELKDADWQRKEAEWRRTEAVLCLQLKQASQP